jgi:hypothetical protein
LCYWIPFRISGIKPIIHLSLSPSLMTTKKHYLNLSSNVIAVFSLLTFSFNL